MIYLTNIYKKHKVIYFFLSAILLCTTFAPLNFEFVAWISLFIFILIIDNDILFLNSFIDGLIFGIILFLPLMYWMFYSLYKVIHTGFYVAIISYILFCLTLSIFIGLSTLIYKKIKIKNTTINRVFLFPSIWVFFEWIRGWIFTGFGWFDIGYTQINNQALKYFLPILGIYGLSWLVISISGVLSLIIPMVFFKKKTNLTILYLGYLIIIIIIGDNLSNINYTKPYGEKIKVALIQSNIGTSNKWIGSSSIDYYAKQIKNIKADIIFTPETAITTFEKFLPTDYLNSLAKFAKKNNANLIIGMPIIIDQYENYVNAVMLVTNSKRPFYSKYHLVPFGEYIPFKDILSTLYSKFSIPMVGFVPGNINQKPMVIGNEKIAFDICYENGFGSELTTASKESTLMANVSDMMWYGNTFAMYQHLQLSQARALENQRYFIQVTNSGVTAIIDKSGKVQSELPPFKDIVLYDEVQGMIGITPYQIYRNKIIISICLGIILLSLLLKKFKD